MYAKICSPYFNQVLPVSATKPVVQVMEKIQWENIEPVLRPYATVTNGYEMYWIGWCWQILEHIGLTTYASDSEKAMVLMRGVGLLRIQQDYAYIMLTIDPYLDEQRLFEELCSFHDCAPKATLQWELRHIVPELLNAYVRWDHRIPRYDPSLSEPEKDNTDKFLLDLRETLPGENKDEQVCAMYPEGYHRREGPSLMEYHQTLDAERRAWTEAWLEEYCMLPKDIPDVLPLFPFVCYPDHFLLYFNASWDDVEPIFQQHLCWGSPEELGWYKEMWEFLRLVGYTGYGVNFEEVFESVLRLVHAYQTFCFLALDRPIALDPIPEIEKLASDETYLDLDMIDWDNNYLVPLLVKSIANEPKNIRVGRFGGLKVDAQQFFLRRILITLPITDKSLTRHYGSESAWSFDGPPGTDLKEYNATLFAERMERIRVWLSSGSLVPFSI